VFHRECPIGFARDARTLLLTGDALRIGYSSYDMLAGVFNQRAILLELLPQPHSHIKLFVFLDLGYRGEPIHIMRVLQTVELEVLTGEQRANY
jgi:hypothetical protein